MITTFDHHGSTVVIVMQYTTAEIFEHLSLALWEGIDVGIRYKYRILKVPAYTKY